MKLEREKSSALERLCAILSTSASRPRAILGCTFPFESAIFDEILDSVADGMRIDRSDLGRIPIDVICDRRLYRGHKYNSLYQVHIYPHPQLFHAKLLIVLLEDKILWLSGSANLTRAGYCRNREITLLHQSGNLRLPKSLRQLLSRLPGEAARVIHEASSDDLPSSIKEGRFVTSLDEPIGPTYLARAPIRVDAIHILAPFFENAAAADSTDEGWLNALVERWPTAKYHIYLPRLEPGRSPCVQGEKQLFENLRKKLTSADQLQFYPVASEPGPLHGKLTALIYRNNQSKRARILVGSPNPSRRALLTPAAVSATSDTHKGNVETAWIADIKASMLSAFLETLSVERSYRLDALQFEPPRYNSEKVWSALARAEFDPEERVLVLTWLGGKGRHGPHDTTVWYGKRRLTVDSDNQVHSFKLDEVNGALTTLPRKRGKAARLHSPGFCPIELRLTDHLLLDTYRTAMTAENWMGLLAGDPGSSVALNNPPSRGAIKRPTTNNAEPFEPSSLVRDLAARLRYARKRLSTPFWSEAEREVMLRVLNGIFESHNPGANGISSAKRIWRGWVRAELTRFVTLAANDQAIREQGLSSTLEGMARNFRGNLQYQFVPPAARKQLNRIARGRE